MLYKTNNEFFKDNLHFRCQCGGDEFLEVSWAEDYYGKDIEFEISFVQCPRGFWDKLKWLFKPEYCSKVILLSKSDGKELKKFLDKILREE